MYFFEKLSSNNTDVASSEIGLRHRLITLELMVGLSGRVYVLSKKSISL